MPNRPVLLLHLLLGLALGAATPNPVDALFARQRELAKGRRQALFGVFEGNLTAEEQGALRFLYAGMPLSDLAAFDGPFFLEAVRASLAARREVPWGAAIPEDVFRHYVLPLRVNNENLDAFRTRTWRELVDRVKGLDLRQAALEINHWCHEHVTYQASDERTSAPLATMRTGLGRCGEESTFTVSALRAACVPARQVYTPRWAHCDDNHAWVEVWVDGGWHYLGACEPEPALDLGWFREPARRVMLVHTRAYGPYTGSEPVIAASPRFAELNVTAHYAPVKALPVEVRDRSGRPVEGASVEFRLYNYGEYYPLATVATDNRGRASLDLGLGDILVWARKGRAFGFRKVSVASGGPVLVTLDGDPAREGVLDLDQVPPAEPLPLPDPAAPAARAENARRLKAEDELRNRGHAGWPGRPEALALAAALGLEGEKVARQIARSAGNGAEIRDFLLGTDARTRPWALPLLDTLSDKDLRDTPAAVLRDHLENGLEGAGPDPDFVPCVLSPRVADELLTPYRAFLRARFPADAAARGRTDPATLAAWTRTHIRLDEAANPYRVPAAPQGVLELGVADAHSRDLFFVALCRSLDIPARLAPALGTPQYRAGGAWKDASLDGPVRQAPTARLHPVSGGGDLKYGAQFTLARFGEGRYATLAFKDDLPLSRLGTPELPAGPGLAVTGNREPGGTVRVRLAFFDLRPGETRDLPLLLRAAPAGPALGPVDPLAAMVVSDMALPLGALCKGKGAVLLWAAPGEEPTRHVMAELKEHRKELDAWGGTLAFLLPPGADGGPDFRGLPAQALCGADPGGRLLAAVAAARKAPLGTAKPLLAALDASARLVYVAEGYQIGVWEQILKCVRTLP